MSGDSIRVVEDAPVKMSLGEVTDGRHRSSIHSSAI